MHDQRFLPKIYQSGGMMQLLIRTLVSHVLLAAGAVYYISNSI